VSTGDAASDSDCRKELQKGVGQPELIRYSFSKPPDRRGLSRVVLSDMVDGEETDCVAQNDAHNERFPI
jgi:hypothetical protein